MKIPGCRIVVRSFRVFFVHLSLNPVAFPSFFAPTFDRYKRVVQRYEDGGALLLALQHMAEDQHHLETKAAAQWVPQKRTKNNAQFALRLHSPQTCIRNPAVLRADNSGHCAFFWVDALASVFPGHLLPAAGLLCAVGWLPR
jgi:hypothetical protein